MSRYREGPTLTVKGKPALVLIVLTPAFLLWHIMVTHDTVAPEVEEHVRELLAAEYSRSLLTGLQASVAAKDDARLKADVDRLLTYRHKISFVSLKSRGGGAHFYVRAEILVDGKAPPVGKSVRYFHFHNSPLIGYVYEEEAWAWDYYLPFMS